MNLTLAEMRTLWLGAANPARRDAKVFKKYYKSDHWRALKAEKLTKKPRCQLCRRRKATQVHHDGYGNFYREHVDRDLIATCGTCHRKIST